MKKAMTIVMMAMALVLAVSPVASNGGGKVEMMRVMDPGGGR